MPKPVEVRPTTEALMLATKLQERYTGVHAPVRAKGEGEGSVTDGVTELSNTVSFGENQDAVEFAAANDAINEDEDFTRLVELLTIMDARTGRPDPSKRKSTKKRKRR